MIDDTPKSLTYPKKILGPNSSHVLLYEGPLVVFHGRNESFPATGKLVYTSTPSSQTCLFLNSLDGVSHMKAMNQFKAAVSIGDRVFQAIFMSFNFSIGKSTQGKWNISGYLEKEITQPNNIEMDEVFFLIPNVSKIFGSPVKIANTYSMARINFRYKDLEIIIDPLDGYAETHDYIKNNEVSALTHVGRINSVQPITSKLLKEVIIKIGQTFSFSFARFTFPLLALGYKDGVLVYQELVADKSIDRFKSNLTWFDDGNSSYIEEFFSKLMDKFFQKNDLLEIHKLIHWYIEVERPGLTIQSKLVLTVTALDYFSWFVLVIVENKLSAEKFNSNSLAKNLRKLLNHASIDSSLKATFLSSRIQEIGNKIQASDGPDLIAKFRNSIVHPNRNSQLDTFVTSEMYTVKSLTSMYLEFLILWYVGYSNNVVNRLEIPHVTGDIIQAPWITNAINE
jgi:hypothetical protein